MFNSCKICLKISRSSCGHRAKRCKIFQPYFDKVHTISYGNTCCGVFLRGEGVTKIERYLPKRINIIKGNYQILRIGIKGRSQNLTFKVDFLCPKWSESFWFFFIEKYPLRSTFFCHGHFWQHHFLNNFTF